ncbi:TldD/PmbA family protein [Halalkalibacillus halophilus]|uniref:TldD/PmbA family protein n=1 Tax=Halalkalibacillus halophilus TaxID=392827 RepID=UPI00041BDAB8|nr:metallopeptidase TldD-related protein [Halalkalibacillus halophilus]
MDIKAFKDQLFKQGQTQGFDDIELYYESSEGLNCQLDLGEVDQFSTQEKIGVSLRGNYQGKIGYAYTEKIDETSIDFLIENAIENAKIIEEKEQNEIYAGDGAYEQMNFVSNEISQLTNDEIISFLKDFDRELYAADERVVGTNFFQVQRQDLKTAMFNTQGLELEDHKNFLFFFLMVIVKENDVKKSGTYVNVVHDWSKLDAKTCAEEAVAEAVSYLNPKAVESDNYPVVLRYDAVSSLLATFTSNFSAETAHKGLSKLKDKVGEKIAGDNITLIDDPFLENGLGSRTFDGEGVGSKRLTVVDNGSLTTLFHNRKTAKKDGMETTGHASRASYKSSIGVEPSNFYLNPGTKSYEELVKSVDEGIIITDLQGLHSGVNPVSGDFSLAANGYYVKDGKQQYATNLMTVAGNFYDLLNQVREVGSDLTFKGSTVGAPSLLVDGLSITVE